MRIQGLLAVSALLLASAPLRGEGGMLPGEKVAATMSPDGESKTASVTVVKGARLSATAKATGGSRVTPVLALADPSGTPEDLGGQGVAKGARASFSVRDLDATGAWLVSVSTPPGRGGAFELSVKAKQPSSVKLAGEGADLAFDAVDGAVAALSVSMEERGAAAPEVVLRAPSGAALGFPAGAGGRTRVSAMLDETGTWTVETPGSAGRARVAGKLAWPKPRKLEWRDAEALPRIASYSPTGSANDTALDMYFSGAAFSTQQVVLVTEGASTRKTAPVAALTPGGARASLDLSGLPAGTYRIRVVTPAGNTATADAPFVVSNRAPAFLSYRPADPPWAPDTALVIDGAGFDPACEISMKRLADDASVPISVTSRTGHGRLDVEIDPLPYQVGPCEIRAADPGGPQSPVPLRLDILGLEAPPADVWSLIGNNTEINATYPRRTAWDTSRSRICLSVRVGPGSVRWMLVDPVTLQPGASVTVTGGTTLRHTDPRVAYHPLDDTYAFSWYVTGDPSGRQEARVRIVRASDLGTVADLQMDSYGRIFEIDCAADTAAGGWLCVWHRWDGNSASNAYLMARRISAAGVPDAGGAKEIHSAPYGLAAYPAIVEAAADRFIVAHLGVNDNFDAWAIRRIVLIGSGGILYPSAETATSPTWSSAFQPEMVRNPETGDILLAFTIEEALTYHPVVQRLTGVGWTGTPIFTVDADGAQPVGFIDSLAWNRARGEYVIATTAGWGEVIIRRMGTDGRIKSAPVLEAYDGIWGVLWSGPDAGDLGFVRLWDGVQDRQYAYGNTVWIRASRIW
ncbi:MAG: hypothetical protein HMLKMBBP_01862 [Planctomycetes bacterium]|nr:hypothetical protein [Planctomycetota bacterium]